MAQSSFIEVLAVPNVFAKRVHFQMFDRIGKCRYSPSTFFSLRSHRFLLLPSREEEIVSLPAATNTGHVFPSIMNCVIAAKMSATICHATSPSPFCHLWWQGGAPGVFGVLSSNLWMEWMSTRKTMHGGELDFTPSRVDYHWNFERGSPRKSPDLTGSLARSFIGVNSCCIQVRRTLSHSARWPRKVQGQQRVRVVVTRDLRQE